MIPLGCSAVDPKQDQGPLAWQANLACGHSFTTTEAEKERIGNQGYCDTCAWSCSVVLWTWPAYA